jgi:uncharacterized membrane protein YgcG
MCVVFVVGGLQLCWLPKQLGAAQFLVNCFGSLQHCPGCCWLQEDFFNDLEKEVNDWSKKRSASGKPASLWEELSAIGEEFVDFLEQGLKDEQQAGKSSSSSSKADRWQGGGAGKEGSSSFQGSSSSGSGSSSYSSSSRARSPVDKFEELKRQYDLYDEGKSSSSSSSSKSR